MMTLLTSISKAGPQTVPLPRSTDTIGAVLRHAFGHPPLPEDMAMLLRQLDHHIVRH